MWRTARTQGTPQTKRDAVDKVKTKSQPGTKGRLCTARTKQKDAVVNGTPFKKEAGDKETPLEGLKILVTTDKTKE
jgi:hypothetical protein